MRTEIKFIHSSKGEGYSIQMQTGKEKALMSKSYSDQELVEIAQNKVFCDFDHTKLCEVFIPKSWSYVRGIRHKAGIVERSFGELTVSPLNKDNSFEVTAVLDSFETYINVRY